ncbi:MAG: cytochrome B [Sphingobacteriaceae bacterium]|nr:MAG: cytochrome B [Sphingobacteriaceae bacterium]
MYSFFKYFHSGLRYLVLILVLAAIIQSFLGWIGRKPYSEGNRKLNLFALIAAHTQLIIGLILYFISPLVQFSKASMKDATARYWTVEHISMMIIAIALITIGYARSKRVSAPEKKHFTVFIFYFLAIIIVVITLILSGRGVFNASNG